MCLGTDDGCLFEGFAQKQERCSVEGAWVVIS